MDVPLTPRRNTTRCAARFLYANGFNGGGARTAPAATSRSVGRGRATRASASGQGDVEHLRTCARAQAGVPRPAFRNAEVSTDGLCVRRPPYMAVSEHGNSASALELREQQAFDWEGRTPSPAPPRGCRRRHHRVERRHPRCGGTSINRNGAGADMPFSVLEVKRAINSDPTKRGSLASSSPRTFPARRVSRRSPTGHRRRRGRHARRAGKRTTVTTAPTPAPRKKKEMPTEPRLIARDLHSEVRRSACPSARATHPSGVAGLQEEPAPALRWFFTGGPGRRQARPEATAELRSLAWPHGAADADGSFVEVECTARAPACSANLRSGQRGAGAPMTGFSAAPGPRRARVLLSSSRPASPSRREPDRRSEPRRYLAIGENIKHPVLV